MNNLGSLYADQAKMQEAEEMLQRALVGFEKALGLEHISTLTTVNNLGSLYVDQGKIQKAEEMYNRALKGKMKAQGPDHSATLDTVNNLGLLYLKQGRMQEAEEMLQQALKGYENAWGSEHISTFEAVSNIGLLYAKLGKIEEAIEMLQRALQGKEKIWGAKHPQTQSILSRVRSLRKHWGKLEEAEPLLRLAVEGRQKQFSTKHPDTPEMSRAQASIYQEQGRDEEAQLLDERIRTGGENEVAALPRVTAILTDPDTLTSAISERKSEINRTLPTKPTSLSDGEFGQVFDKLDNTASIPGALTQTAQISTENFTNTDDDDDRWSIRTTSTLLNLDPDRQLQGKTQFALALFERIGTSSEDELNIRDEAYEAVSGALIMYSHAMQQQAKSSAERIATKLIRQQST